MPLPRHINSTVENKGAHALPLELSQDPGMKPALAHTFHNTLQQYYSTPGILFMDWYNTEKHNMKLCFAMLIITDVPS